ncbi:MAG: alpha-galactosidase [Ruminococcaceae bacterium]|nr:alpha-galactosidase [Oscillospiraceae bacterium]
MIKKQNDIFKLDTKNTSYIFRVMNTGHLEQLYYGAFVSDNDGYDALYEKSEVEYANSVLYCKDSGVVSLEQLCLEISGVGRGDFREAAVDLTLDDGSYVTDFVFNSYKIYDGKREINGLPSSFGDCTTLEIQLEDTVIDAKLTLFYHVFEACDIITRHMTVTAGGKTLTLTRAMSAMMDFPRGNFKLMTLCGTWADEMQKNEIELKRGVFCNDSKLGVSSNQHNPFMLLSDKNASEKSGDCYGFNLVYSGNHCEMAEVSAQNRTRVLLGINPFHFSHRLNSGESFETPEAVMTFSSCGSEGVSHAFHKFIREHIVRGAWAKKQRPVLVNSWEANYFDFDEEKLVAQAKAAAALGAELYVLDDGWFGKRNDDKSSLGDWFVNLEKLPNGLDGLQRRFAEIPIKLGLWIEPEMVSVDSELYKLHPDWAVAVRGSHFTMGRNQLLLDITRGEVRDYIVDVITNALKTSRASYIKWDMNRNIAEVFWLCEEHNSDFYHRYTLGFYDLMRRITGAFPDVLFEGCSAGGNRFDLGVLCYMPQIWLSDNTDAHRRAALQQNASMCYPQSVMGAHVSACPCHQTGRTTSLETRFAVACSGVLGYELDVASLDNAQREAVSQQIRFYKENANLLQFGTIYPLSFEEFDGAQGWIIVAPNKEKAIVMLYQSTFVANRRSLVMRLEGLAKDKKYRFESIDKRETHTATGDLLCRAGVRLNQRVMLENGEEKVRVMGDYSALLYEITQMQP